MVKRRRTRRHTKRRRSRRHRGGGHICQMIRRLRHPFSHPKKGQRSRTRHGRLDFITHKGDSTFNRRGHRQRRRRKPYTKKRRRRRRRRRTQRGGYSQFQSDVPRTNTMQTPNGPQGGTWEGQLATPPTYKILNNCQDNYNHYTQK